MITDNELRQRRVGQEAEAIRKKQRETRIYKIAGKPEPTNWCCIALIVFLILGTILLLIEAFTGFRTFKRLFGSS